MDRRSKSLEKKPDHGDVECANGAPWGSEARRRALGLSSIAAGLFGLGAHIEHPHFPVSPESADDSDWVSWSDHPDRIDSRANW